MGIGNADRRKNRGFECLHGLRLGVVRVVAAEQVQQPVHDEMLQMGLQGDAARAGLPMEGLRRQQNVAEVALVADTDTGAGRPLIGKRQDVGCAGPAAIGEN